MGDRCTVKGVKESDRSPDQCAGTRGAQAKVICQEKNSSSCHRKTGDGMRRETLTLGFLAGWPPACSTAPSGG